MNPSSRSVRSSFIAAWPLLLTLVSCGGSTSGLENEPVGGAAGHAAAESSPRLLSAPPGAMAHDRVAVVGTPSADPRPEVPRPTGCGSDADQPVAVDSARAVEEAPEPGEDASEPEPAAAPQDVALAPG
jgi:hypothetical protein